MLSMLLLLLLLLLCLWWPLPGWPSVAGCALRETS